MPCLYWTTFTNTTDKQKRKTGWLGRSKTSNSRRWSAGFELHWEVSGLYLFDTRSKVGLTSCLSFLLAFWEGRWGLWVANRRTFHDDTTCRRSRPRFPPQSCWRLREGKTWRWRLQLWTAWTRAPCCPAAGREREITSVTSSWFRLYVNPSCQAQPIKITWQVFFVCFFTHNLSWSSIKNGFRVLAAQV